MVALKILIDSGVTKNRNVGDNAILDKTLRLEWMNDTHVLHADYLVDRETFTIQHFFRFLKSIIECDGLQICCGGLFKPYAHKFVLRKLLAVFLAKLFRKKVWVDPQTVYLKGIYRILFKMAFQNIVVPCRDASSLLDCEDLGLNCIRWDDILLDRNSRWNMASTKRVGFDGRYRLRRGGVFDNGVSAYCEYLKLYFSIHDWEVKEIATIQTDLHWKSLEQFYAKIDTSVCVSFHAAVFSLNAGVRKVICVYGDEYYRRKFSALKNVELIDVRKLEKW